MIVTVAKGRKMNSDIRISITLTDHPKRRKLSELLKQESVGYLIDLWIAVAMRRPEGILTAWDETDIAFAARWRGDPKDFVSSLLSAGFIETNGKNYVLHNWYKHQPFIVDGKIRSEIYRENAKKRWEKKCRIANGDIDSNAISNANSYANHSKEKKSKEEYSKKEGCGEKTSVLSYLESLKDGVEYNPPSLNDYDYKAIIVLPYDDTDVCQNTLINIARIWIIYHQLFPFGTSLKGSEKKIRGLLADGWDYDDIIAKVKESKKIFNSKQTKFWELFPDKTEKPHNKPIYKFTKE